MGGPAPPLVLSLKQLSALLSDMGLHLEHTGSGVTLLGLPEQPLGSGWQWVEDCPLRPFHRRGAAAWVRESAV